MVPVCGDSDCVLVGVGGSLQFEERKDGRTTRLLGGRRSEQRRTDVGGQAGRHVDRGQHAGKGPVRVEHRPA